MSGKKQGATGFARARSAHALAFIAATVAAHSAMALEVTAGDYEVYPAGVNIMPIYYQHAERSESYVNGKKVASDFALKSDSRRCPKADRAQSD